ncbi:hypothetical protein AGLY_014576 [Aphis glycines]|uniref:Uncharacterized protein n=1 Tax=Aphis glycines TaxID=307491 RepID=A0A6G0T1L1_APHGL|nr:hypothetical protein AGLY_014576 [Aphis glycines]
MTIQALHFLQFFLNRLLQYFLALFVLNKFLTSPVLTLHPVDFLLSSSESFHFFSFLEPITTAAFLPLNEMCNGGTRSPSAEDPANGVDGFPKCLLSTLHKGELPNETSTLYGSFFSVNFFNRNFIFSAGAVSLRREVGEPVSSSSENTELDLSFLSSTTGKFLIFSSVSLSELLSLDIGSISPVNGFMRNCRCLPEEVKGGDFIG